MYINFLQTRVSRSVQTVHTNVFANNRKLHKIATTNSNFENIDYLDMHHRITQAYMQWCSGKFSLVGTLTWHYGHIPNRYRGGGGGGVPESFLKV